MTCNYCFKVRSLVSAVILSIGLGFISPAFAQQVAFFMVDIDNRAWTRLDYAARDINNNGDILANSFVVGPNGTGKIDLKALGGDFIRTWAINDSRQVVGASTTAQQEIFVPSSPVPRGWGQKNLGTLGGDFSEAYDINDAGQVVGGLHL